MTAVDHMRMKEDRKPNHCLPFGARPACGASIENINTLGLRDLETVGVGAFYEALFV